VLWAIVCMFACAYGCVQEKAVRAMDYLWQSRHRASDLVGTVINIHNGDWVRRGKYYSLI